MAIRFPWHPAMHRTGRHPNVLNDCQSTSPAIASGGTPPPGEGLLQQERYRARQGKSDARRTMHALSAATGRAKTRRSEVERRAFFTEEPV